MTDTLEWDSPKGFWEAYLPHPSTWVHVTRLRRHHEPREPCPGCAGKGYRAETIRWGEAGVYHRERRVRCGNCRGSGSVPGDVEP